MSWVLAFDPGKETGWARLSPSGEFQSGQQPLQYVLHFVFETLKQGFKPVLVCEDFIFTIETMKKSRQSWSTEGIGVLRFLAKEYGVPFVVQTAASAKSFASNAKLKKIGWYTPGQDHANDAARHLLVYAVGNGLVSVRDFKENNADSRD